MKRFKPGDIVMVISETYGWGPIRRGDIGTVLYVTPNSSKDIYVKFPNHPNWVGTASDFTHYQLNKNRKTLPYLKSKKDWSRIL